MSQTGPCLWTRLPQSSRSPCDRYKLACCSHQGSVYVLGGRHSTSLRDFWRYSVVCDEWTELSCLGDAAPEELEEHTMVAHQDRLYVFGGMLDSAYTRSTSPLWVFDVVKEKWLHLQGKTSSRQSLRPTNRKGHSAVVVGSTMLVYGGLVDMKGSSQDFWSLDFDTMVWSQLSGSQQDSLGPGPGPGPGPRHSHSAAADQTCMFLFGGLKGLREQRDFWSWSSRTSTWTSLRTKSGPPRLTGHSAVLYQDSMLIFGGGETQNSPRNRLWRFSFSTQTWSQLASLPGPGPPDKIHHCCAGLGPSYSRVLPLSDSGPQAGPPAGRPRPFKNRCVPAPLEFLGSDGAIELETFGPDRCYGSRTPPPDPPSDPRVEGALTYENKAFRKQWSCNEEDLDLDLDHQDLVQQLPDLLLVLGGRPWTRHSPISVWQMTLKDS